MKTEFLKVSNSKEDLNKCPFPLEVIPNNMGINLCCVDSVLWTEQKDGQLVNITINFIPEEV